MPSYVCTLFEKHHHHGVAALINSLYRNNYRGPVYAGYKGDLPAWCSSGKPNPEIEWENASTLHIAEDLKVHFLPIKTEFHLTFYKPYFMIELFKTVASDADGIAYFDPDIVIKCTWAAFEAWMGYGVALVDERVDWPPTHPLKGEWKKVIHKINRQTTRHLHSYINGGFCGVAKQNIEFLTVWIEVTDAAIKYFNLNQASWARTRNRTYLFHNADQDALNIAVMCCDSPVSEIGPEGMDFVRGESVMSHAIGGPKPWKKKFIRSALKGIGPGLADRAYWFYSKGPIQLYSKNFLKFQHIKISIAAFISRFYRRS